MAEMLLLEFEEWRTTQWPHYLVSSFGRVRSLPRAKSKGKILVPLLVGGYRMVRLCESGKIKQEKIATLVCDAFHGKKPSSTHEVAHGDGNPINDHKRNLRWATRKENGEDKVRHGRSLRGSKHPNARLREDDVRAIRQRLGRETCRVIADDYAVHHSTIRLIASGKTWWWLT